MRKGFTLIELIVVIAIIAVLAAIVAVNAFRAIEKAKISRAIADFKAIKAACGALYADTSYWPHGGDSSGRVDQSELMTNVYNYFGWDGPYLESGIPVHPWRGIYSFTSNTNLARSATVGKNGIYELSLEYEDVCYPNGPNGGCPIPLASKTKIDKTVDDGQYNGGDFQYDNSEVGDIWWVLQWDFCTPPSGQTWCW